MSLIHCKHSIIEEDTVRILIDKDKGEVGPVLI
jgi:hypothetical protein